MLVVASSDVDTVYVLDSITGEVVRTFGSTGKATMQFNTPCGVCVTRDGNIIVADWGNNRLQEVLDRGRSGSARVLGKRLPAPCFVALTVAEDALVVLQHRPHEAPGVDSQKQLAWSVVVLARDATCTLRVLLTNMDIIPLDPPPSFRICGFSTRGGVVAVLEGSRVVLSDVSGKWKRAICLKDGCAPAASFVAPDSSFPPLGVGFDTRAPDDQARLWIAFQPYFAVLAWR